MSFWSALFGRPNFEGVVPNANPSPADPPTVGVPDYTPGDPEGLDLSAFADRGMEARSLSFPQVSPWDGWPAEWSTPSWNWGSRFNALVDIAWACIDLNARVMSAMPVYRTRGGRIIEPTTWMRNPDPSTYASWSEFAKQLFRDYWMGEAFVLPIMRGANDFPFSFRVIPPWMMNVEMRGSVREYHLGAADVTEDILHIRYDSSTNEPRGRGPLEVAGGRQITAGLIEKYTREMVSTGGVPDYTLNADESLSEDEAQDLMNTWMASRQSNLGAPPVLDNGVELNTYQSMSPKDMAMIEIATFNEARIAVLLGVPPFIVGLPSASGESMTYSNVSQVFDQHDRMALRPAATAVMPALSGWALPSTQSAELNRDEYSRPDFAARAEAAVKLIGVGALSVEEFRAAERLLGDTPESPTLAATALTGGEE